jgi:hypothetical protein
MASKIEMKCGKNAKAMKMAHSMENQLGDDFQSVTQLLQNGFP